MSVTPAAASTANGSSAWPGPRASATQNTPPSGSRERLSTFGSVKSRFAGGWDIRARAAYHWMEAAMNPPDQIARCVVVDDAEVALARAVIVTSTGVAREAARRHQAGGAAAVALARGLTSGLLLATLTKDEERVTLQVLGDGPLGGLTVDATAAGTARAYVKNPAVRLPPPRPGEARASIGAAIGRMGLVSVIR